MRRIKEKYQSAMDTNWKIVSGSGLKVLAVLSMIVDHVGGWILTDYSWAWETLYAIGDLQITWMFICRGIIGRIAFPIFAFLLVEGYVHTRNSHRYLYTMLAWAVITQPCCNLVHGLPWYSFWNGLNVLFSLAAGLVALQVHDSARLSATWKTVCWLLLMVAAYLCRMDYGAMGVSFILLLYVLRGNMGLVLAATLGCFMKKWPFAGLSWVLMTMYNGKRGFIHGNCGKYLFYAIYPLHMLAIWAVRTFLL